MFLGARILCLDAHSGILMRQPDGWWARVDPITRTMLRHRCTGWLQPERGLPKKRGGPVLFVMVGCVLTAPAGTEALKSAVGEWSHGRCGRCRLTWLAAHRPIHEAGFSTSSYGSAGGGFALPCGADRNLALARNRRERTRRNVTPLPQSRIPSREPSRR
jgi:hypothetical protein